MDLAMGVPVEQGVQLGGLGATSEPPPVPVQEADLGPAAADVPLQHPAAPHPLLKTCRNCGEKKMRTDFHKNHSKADELEDVCRPCKALRDANRRALRASVSADCIPSICYLSRCLSPSSSWRKCQDREGWKEKFEKLLQRT